MAGITTKSPLEFFGETVAAAGGRFTGEKYTRALDDIFASAAADANIEMLLMLRKGNEVFFVGLLDGKVVQERADIRRLLLPIVTTF